MSPVLSLLALFTANPVFLAAANGSADGGKYVVEIRGESAIDPSQVTARLDKRLLTLYVVGGKVRADNRSWGQGQERVKAHRHEGKVELEVPLPSDCGGRVNIAAGGEGVVVASVSCPTLAAGKQASTVDVVAVVAPKAVPVAKPVEAMPAKAAPENKEAPGASENDALLAAVALAKPTPAPKPEVKPEPKVQTPVAEAPKAVAAPVKTAAPAPAATQASLWGAAMKALFPVLLLGGLAVLGLRFAKKRRAVGRHVKILETTQLGPKRSLIVAKVGNETLLLGASEAGIALIQVRPSNAVEDSMRPETEEDIDVSPKWADVLPADFRPKPANDEDENGQATMLSRLFRKRRQDIPEAWPFANVLDASLMEESVEDRELREKLAMGMEARVR
ncbi:MAG: flagellar biosynthetic protein FliO [Deltaproteobacteria bacterium]|nr:flagellar biosynthetic protein FliO [Deltaproteobacteria bacterium]